LFVASPLLQAVDPGGVATTSDGFSFDWDEICLVQAIAKEAKAQ
jgi:hypothetical protein